MRYPCFVVYENKMGEWRWRMWARNGRMKCNGRADFSHRRASAIRAAKGMTDLLATPLPVWVLPRLGKETRIYR